MAFVLGVIAVFVEASFPTRTERDALQLARKARKPSLYKSTRPTILRI